MECKFCKNKIEEDFMKVNGNAFHYNCFVEYATNRSRKRLSLIEAMGLVEEYKEKEMQNRNRAKFLSYISKEYGIVFFPKTTFIKLSSIQNGTFKGMFCSISYAELYEMFVMMKNYLIKTRMKMDSRGRGIEGGLNSFNYDLAIVLNNYDKYLKYKEEQKKTKITTKEIRENIIQHDDNKIEVCASKKAKIETSIVDEIDEFF